MDRAGDERGTRHVAARKGPEMERREIQRLARHTSSLLRDRRGNMRAGKHTHLHTCTCARPSIPLHTGRDIRRGEKLN